MEQPLDIARVVAAVATAGMKQDVETLYDNIDAWKGDRKPPFSAAVWRFVNEAGAAAKATAG